MFSTDSYSWTHPVAVTVTEVGRTPAGRDYAVLQLADDRSLVVAGHASMTLEAPRRGKKTPVDVYLDVVPGREMPRNPAEWAELYVDAEEAERAAAQALRSR